MIRTQLNYMFHKKGFWISFFAIMAYVVITFLTTVSENYNSDIVSMTDVRHLTALSIDTPYFSYFVLLFPFLVVFPFATSTFEDVENKSINMWIYRCGKGRYFFSKAITNIIGGMLITMIPFLISVVMTFLFFPITYNTDLGIIGLGEFAGNVIDSISGGYKYPFLSIYTFHPFIYELGLIVCLGIFTGLVCFWAYSFSLYIKTYKILLFLPIYLVFWLLDTLDSSFSISLDLLSYVTLQGISGKDYIVFACICAAISLLAIINLFIFKKKDVK